MQLHNPFAPKPSEPESIASGSQNATAKSENLQDQFKRRAVDLAERGRRAGRGNTQKQHRRQRMTVWERLSVLSKKAPEEMFVNWGAKLDGGSLVTAILEINRRKVAVYGHDFTVRAGSVDADNGLKLARLFEFAGKNKMPVIGMNDSAGAYVPAGVGGLNGYAQAFAALRKISGISPSIMCMFGFNAGGGSYLPRQGSFIIQPRETFFGLTGPDVVKSVLGEQVTPDELGGPDVHSQSGVSDFVAEDERDALEMAVRLLDYLPDSSSSAPARYEQVRDSETRATVGIDLLLRRAFGSPAGINTPFDISILAGYLFDYGDYLEVQATRARNTLTAFGRMGGHVVGVVANNSMVSSGQIDIDAAYKNARFIRFCNLYNIPLIFIEDTTGFLPGLDQERRGIVQAGRAMLDAIIDVRTPRFLVIVRNAFGGAYAAFNNYATGADLALALPSARVAVMGPAGIAYIYKKELKAIASQQKSKGKKWQAEQEALLRTRYEQELMNAEKALSLGSISRIVMPEELRKTLCWNLNLHLERYQPQPFLGVQREFH